MTCSTDEPNYQPFPDRGPLIKNLTLNQLTDQLMPAFENATLYCYIVDTIRNENGYFIQTGSGPNFQGDMITLCTCKHFMRTFQTVDAWQGKWVAGFTGVQAGGGRNALVYLMRVAHAFESHRDLWFSETIPERTKQAKSASRSKFGDIFQPIQPFEPFNPQSYKLPHRNHSHIGGHYWHKDVTYHHWGRPAALLAGDVANSFLWNKPMHFSGTRLYRGQTKPSLGDMLRQLKTGEIK